MHPFKMYKLDPVFNVSELINASYYSLPRGFVFEGERHDFWELIYVDRGRIIVGSDSYSYRMLAGEMAFYTPGEFHAFHLDEDRPASVVVISFNCERSPLDAFEDKILVLGDAEKACLSTIVAEAADTFVHFDNLPAAIDLERAAHPPFGSEQIIKNRLEELFIRIYRRRENIPIASRAVSPALLRDSSALVSQVQDYLREHCAEKLTLDGVAAAHNVSAAWLRKAFRAQVGFPVMTYLTRLRMAEAKRLIREGTLNFTQIAEAVGYDGIYYFSAAFKRQVGMTPTEYSRSVRRGE